MAQESRSIAIKDVVIDMNLNPRLELDKDTIEHYMEIFDQLPPVVAFETERGLIMVDGFHRYQAAKARGLGHLACEVRQGTYREAMEYAALANLRHGKPLTTRERSRVAETLWVLHPDWSVRQIAGTAGCSNANAGNIRQRLVADGRVSKLDAWSPALIESPVSTPPELPPDPWADMVLEGDTFSILPTIPDQSMDLIFVDPPYGILDRQEWDKFASTQDLMRFTRQWLDLLVPKLKPTGRLYICYSQWYVHLLRALMRRYERQYELIYSNTIIWHYKNSLAKPNDRSEYKLSHDPVLYYRARYAPPARLYRLRRGARRRMDHCHATEQFH